MKVHTTNYTNTFIEVAEDCPVTSGETPPVKGDSKTVASMQFELVSKHPYLFTSDDVLFQCFAQKNDIPESEWKEAREAFFSKGQPCFRASPLTKRYGWGLHCDQDGKVALYASGTPAYQNFASNPALKVVKAMKSKK